MADLGFGKDAAETLQGGTGDPSYIAFIHGFMSVTAVSLSNPISHRTHGSPLFNRLHFDLGFHVSSQCQSVPPPADLSSFYLGCLIFTFLQVIWELISLGTKPQDPSTKRVQKCSTIGKSSASPVKTYSRTFWAKIKRRAQPSHKTSSRLAQSL